jgi:tellurite methyltransferase
MGNRSVDFFEAQFQRQALEGERSLNPFETLALEHLSGRVLDLGCGLGNLSLAAARRGHAVVAVDASPTAIAHLRADAQRERLPIEVLQADLACWDVDRGYDTIVSIGFLMFLARPRALRLLRDLQEHVAPGGRAVVNVLVEGTTYMEMFEPGGCCLFGREELLQAFAGWRVLAWRHDSFPAPGETRKDFATLVAERPPVVPRGPSGRTEA